MTFSDLKKQVGSDNLGDQMHRLISDLYPICRSMTGDGFRTTMRILQQHIPVDVHEVPTGTQAFDWTVPKEWNVRDAYVKNRRGDRVIDFKKSNLHVLQYSVPLRATVSRDELMKHIISIPDNPGVIPYRTSYYRETWGFCVAHSQLQQLDEAEYEVVIDATLENGHLTYGEYHIKGETDDEILISCHSCHPSLCNDNLSGVAVSSFLAKQLSTLRLRYSYRFLFVPGTIGPIVWLSRNERVASRIKHGLVLSCLGDGGDFTYKRSRRGDAEIDRAVYHILKHSGHRHSIREFSPYGYDERQYCSPAFNLPVGLLMRTPYGEFPEYHTSADNLDFVGSAQLEESLAQCIAIVSLLENNRTFVNQNPKCEPHLGKRGLYSELGGRSHPTNLELAMLWVLNLSDGTNSLLDIAERASIDFEMLNEAAALLAQYDLLKVV